ncbi:DUF6801 domain-containing protein [Phycicoccus flavus]|uniref:DUF6801 domain-containing protein n=1 Tax=Phycicoccus flavus TaxID=2502783 RepID=UPI000FEBD979|nr:DUF6801 domain-containing protein [Phycicoccus flavus]NHA69673.1 hypothetical protein [Phycicoccus flavus]
MCRWYVSLDGGPTGTDDGTGRFDTALVDGATVRAGEPFGFDPSTGRFDLPQDFVDALRAQGDTEFFGYASVEAPWDVVGGRQSIGMDVPLTPIPATGPMTIPLVGSRNGTETLTEPGTYTLVAGQFGLVSDDDFAGLVCTVAPGVPTEVRAIDTLTVTPATPTPTPTGEPTSTPTTTAGPSATATPPATASPAATVTAAPVRPVLVQTDAAEHDGPSGLPATLAALLGAGLLAGGVLARRRTATRRH